MFPSVALQLAGGSTPSQSRHNLSNYRLSRFGAITLISVEWRFAVAKAKWPACSIRTNPIHI